MILEMASGLNCAVDTRGASLVVVPPFLQRLFVVLLALDFLTFHLLLLHLIFVAATLMVRLLLLIIIIIIIGTFMLRLHALSSLVGAPMRAPCTFTVEFGRLLVLGPCDPSYGTFHLLYLQSQMAPHHRP